MKEFDIEAAKQGATVCTRDGLPARIIAYDRKWLDHYILMVLVDYDGREVTRSYRPCGSAYSGSNPNFDLMMCDDDHQDRLIAAQIDRLNDTKLTVDKIQLALRNSGIWNKRQDVFVPNLSWGLLNYEADLVVMTKSGYLTEIEIKRSWEDFKADFKKDHNHDDPRVYKFHYCVPESIKDRAIDLLKEKYGDNLPSVLYYTESGNIHRIGDGNPYKNGRKLFIEEQLTIARLGCMRVWNLKEKLLKINNIKQSNL